MSQSTLPPFDPATHVFHRARVGGHTPLPPPPEGLQLERVWRVLDAERIKHEGLVHNRTAFLEDLGHDWKLTANGELRYSTRQAEVGEWLDIVLDYDSPDVTLRRAPPPRFDPMTGKPVGVGRGHGVGKLGRAP